MNKTRRITANLPQNLLKEATETTGQGITDTLIEGLKLVRRGRALDLAQNLRDLKIELSDLNLETSRERTRR